MVLRKLVASLFTGPLFVLVMLVFGTIRSQPDGIPELIQFDYVASLFLLGSYAYLFTYGLLCSFAVDLILEKLNPRTPVLIRLSLYLLAALWMYIMMDPARNKPDSAGLILAACIQCALIFFAVEELLLRTGWLNRHKKLVVAVGIVLPLILSLRTGWLILKPWLNQLL
jgi:hypothetical protein